MTPYFLSLNQFYSNFSKQDFIEANLRYVWDPAVEYFVITRLNTTNNKKIRTTITKKGRKLHFWRTFQNCSKTQNRSFLCVIRYISCNYMKPEVYLSTEPIFTFQELSIWMFEIDTIQEFELFYLKQLVNISQLVHASLPRCVSVILQKNFERKKKIILT